LYYFTIHQLGSPQGNIDTGGMWGSYIGLVLLGAGYVSIGLFASSLTDNQIVSFVLSAFLCFFTYSVLGQLSGLFPTGKLNYYTEWLGIDFHYQSISRGVVDTRDVIYFISLVAVFLGLTKLSFSRRKW